MPTVWMLGDSNTVLAGGTLVNLMAAGAVIPPPGWSVELRAQNGMRSDRGLQYVVEQVATGAAPAVAFICFGAADVGDAFATAHPDGPPPIDGVPRSASRAGYTDWLIADYLTRHGTHAVLCRGVGALTVPHPQDPAAGLTPRQWEFFAAADDGYRATALEFQTWPYQCSYHVPNDPTFFLPDHVHLSLPLGGQSVACRVVQYLRTAGLWPS